jgi:hypothetical protein
MEKAILLDQYIREQHARVERRGWIHGALNPRLRSTRKLYERILESQYHNNLAVFTPA